jgi:glycosyltransferase involved in cell wall biosynthesis
MRVGVFAHRLSQRQPTGIARYVRELVCALPAVANERTSFVAASTRESEDTGWVPPQVQTRVLPWPRRPVQMSWSLALGPALERSLGPLDVVHLMQPFPPVKTRAPQVLTVHDLFPLSDPGWYRRSEQWTYRRSIELGLRRARVIIVPSAYVARHLETLLSVAPERIEAIPLGVSGVFASPREAATIEATCRRFDVTPGAYVVCIGQVSTRKNLVPLVRAFAQLPVDVRMPLVMIGPDAHGVEDVDAEIGRLNHGVQVRRTGFLPDADAAALVNGAAVLAHPALGEGFGFVPLEAMAAGTPVIAAASSAVPEVTGDGALLVQAPSDPDAWADALTALLGDSGRRAAMAVAGERRAAEFSWSEHAVRTLDVYARVTDA